MEMSGDSMGVEQRHYGKRRTNRACTHCKAAKTKCIMNPGNDGSCERCSHFTLECVAALPAVRRRRQERNSRVSELEQKLDNIMTLLTNPQQQQTQNEPLGFDKSVPELWSTPASQDTINRTPSSIGDDSAAVGSELRSRSQPYEPNSSSTSNLEQIPFPAEPSLPIRPPRMHQNQSLLPLGLAYQPAVLDPDELLSFFRNQLTELFPFVVIPQRTTARELRQQKPFFLDSILLVASKQRVASQREAGDKLLTYLSEHLILRGEKSLDLLQGLLVYLAWGNYQFHSSAQMSALLQLAVALVAELYLGKMPRSIPDPKTSLAHAVGLTAASPPKAPITHTTDEMRAFVGCFYLSSVFSQCYKKLTAMRHTAYLEQCCKLLDEATEYPTDAYLTSLVRVQLFLSRGLESSLFDESEELASSPAAVNIVEISLLEIGLYDHHRPDPPGIQRLRHLDQLTDCLTAARTFFDRWFQLPNSIYANLPIVAWAQVANAIVATSKIVLLDRQDWDLEHAREVADFANNLEKVASRVEEATHTLFKGNMGSDAKGALLRYAQRVRWVKGWYEGRVVAEQTQSQAQFQVQEGGLEKVVLPPTGGEDAVMTGEFLDLDDVFWQDFVGEWSAVYGTNHDIPIGQ
ncbi:hypothetical protein EG329_004884 [Mollisiaceae sp. DMI_Dod_QoI]|nr:hypothetical protein EG329_004884 [Helotiales sp. DMI_Dod_QoI]